MLKYYFIHLIKGMKYNLYCQMIIITAPHSLCEDNDIESHECDVITGDMAQRLYDKLIENGINAKLFLSTERRVKCDLNRIVCRNTQYRNNVRKYMEMNPVFLFDIHSFPYNYKHLSMYILDDYTIKPKKYSVNLLDFLVKNNIDVKLYQGIHNDIEDEARSMGIDSVLIEFNENLTIYERNYIIDKLYDWISKRYNY